MALTKPQGDMVMKLATEQASTSGTAITFSSIPAGTRMIVVNLVGVSTNGTSALLVQLGDAGGPEAASYVGATFSISSGVAWSAGIIAFLVFGTGYKSLSAELTSITVTTASGDTFDAGSINIAYF